MRGGMGRWRVIMMTMMAAVHAEGAGSGDVGALRGDAYQYPAPSPTGVSPSKW